MADSEPLTSGLVYYLFMTQTTHMLTCVHACTRSLSSFDDKVSGLRAAAADEASHAARKLVDSLESASDIDLSELTLSRRSLTTTAGGCYPPYGGYGPIYPPSYPCPPPPAATSSPPPAAPPPPGDR